MILRGIVAVMLLAMPTAASAADRAPVTLFVAASAEGPARVVARMFESARYDQRVVVRAEASSRLANDVLAGALPDLFLSADRANADRLVAAGLADPATRVDLLASGVVVVGAVRDTLRDRARDRAAGALDSPAALASLADLAAPGAGAVALCDSLVPLGAYARELLRAAGVWDSVAARALPAADARAALAAVESGAANFAIVYATQSENTKRARVVWRPPPGAGPDVRYSLAMMRRSSRRPEAIALYQFLVSDSAARVFSRYGFRPLLPAPSSPSRAPGP